MSRRPEISHKKPPEILADLLDGHREATLESPTQARKYLERSLDKHHSMPNAVKFFLYDLLAEAAAATDQAATRDHAVTQALLYWEHARADLPRQWKDWLPGVRCYAVAIDAAMDEGAFERALELAEQAIALGLGRHYEQKAEMLRWMT